MNQQFEFQYRAVADGFLGVIRRHAGESTSVGGPLSQTILTEQAVLEARHADWVVDEASRCHLRLTALILAAYRTLSASMSDKEEILSLLRRALIEPSRPRVRGGTAMMLDHAPDPMAAIVKVSKDREEGFYGSSFTFVRERDDAGAYLLNIEGCFYHRFFTANGAPELTPVMCDWDTNTWAEAIVPERHGFRFERPTTLGDGGDKCRFHFRRTGEEPRSNEE